MVLPIDPGPISPNPLISVIIPSYNLARFLPEAVRSVQQQTYTNWELVISDDGSNDDSPQAMETFAAEDARIRCLFFPHRGDIATLNSLMAASRGEIIAQIDADDVWLPRKLERLLEAARRAPSAGLLYHPLLEVTAERIPFGRREASPSGWYGPAMAASGRVPQAPPSSGLALRRCMIELIFPLPETYKIFGDTTWCWQAAALTPVELVSRQALGELRYHGSNSHSTRALDMANLLQFSQCMERAFSLAKSKAQLPGPWPLPHLFTSTDALYRKLSGQISARTYLRTVHSCPTWRDKPAAARATAWLAAALPRRIFLKFHNLAWRCMILYHRLRGTRRQALDRA